MGFAVKPNCLKYIRPLIFFVDFETTRIGDLMQIKSLRLKSYRSWKVDETVISDLAKQRRDKIILYEKLRANGCS